MGPICDKNQVIQIGRYLLSLDTNIQSLSFTSASNRPPRKLEADLDSGNLPLRQACIYAMVHIQIGRDMYNIPPIISGCLGELRDWLGRCLIVWYVLFEVCLTWSRIVKLISHVRPCSFPLPSPTSPLLANWLVPMAPNFWRLNGSIWWSKMFTVTINCCQLATINAISPTFDYRWLHCLPKPTVDSCIAVVSRSKVAFIGVPGVLGKHLLCPVSYLSYFSLDWYSLTLSARKLMYLNLNHLLKSHSKYFSWVWGLRYWGHGSGWASTPTKH